MKVTAPHPTLPEARVVFYSDTPIIHPDERGVTLQLHYACNADLRAKQLVWIDIARDLVIEP